MVGRRVRTLAYRYLYPVACYKCPKSLLVYDKPVERSTFYAKYPEDSREEETPGKRLAGKKA